jgi:pimeloyl-ACP methyl ester carboxylesterase
MPALARHFTVVAPDLRGAGGSSKPSAGYTKRELAADLHALVSQQFGDQPVNLCGYDWGADICERFFVGRERDLLAWYFWRGSDNPNAISMDDFEVYVRTLQLPNALRTGMEYFAAVWEDAEDNKQFARTKLSMPVLALGGEKAIGKGVEQAALQLAGNVQGGVIKNAGHWLSDERPEELTAMLLGFFNPSRS